MKALVALILVTLLCVSCNRTLYGISILDCNPRDTGAAGPEVRIINAGKVGISSVQLKTENGTITLCGVKPGDTSSYFRVPPICRNSYKISMVWRSSFGKVYGNTLLSGRSRYQPECELISSNRCSILIQIKDRGFGTSGVNFITGDGN